MLLTSDFYLLSLQKEVVQFLTQQQLEDSEQLCSQALHGDGGQRCLLWGRQAANGGQTLGRRVQPSPASQTGTGDTFPDHWCADKQLMGRGQLWLYCALKMCFLLPGGHYADVCGGDDRQARQTSLPFGTLHRGQVHQIQLQLRFCEGRQHPTHSTGGWHRLWVSAHVQLITGLSNAHLFASIRPSVTSPSSGRATSWSW